MDAKSYPIWPPYEVFYIESLMFNTVSACRSIEVLVGVLKYVQQHTDTPSSIDTHAVLDELQNIVTQGGAISRYFWPARKGHELRAERLRQALEVGDANPLADRAVRNDVEHFDEKLDRYLANGVVGTILPEYFGPKPDRNEVPSHFFRAYFFDTGEFRLLGNVYEVQPIADEIVRIHNALVQMFSSGGRLPEPLIR